MVTKGENRVTPRRVLIVCTGNICRSPMAYGLLRARLERAGLSDLIHVETAGTYALEGEPPSLGARRAMAARGIDISHHRGRMVTREMLLDADVILVMTEAHRSSLFHLAPEALKNVFLLSELAGEHRDIPDPYGGPQEAYEAVAAMLETYIERAWPRLLRHLDIPQPATTEEES